MASVELPLEVTCICAGIFDRALTRGRTYPCLDADPEKRQFRVTGDNGRTRWYPSYCFSEGRVEVPLLVSHVIDDPLDLSVVEVTVTLSNGEKRWCMFTEPGRLAGLGDQLKSGAMLLTGCAHFMILSSLNETSIAEALQLVEVQGELVESTLPLE